MKIIFLKLSEIYLKKRNLPYFLELIKQNISFVLEQFSGTLLFQSNRFYINNFKVDQEAELINVLKRIPGIYAVLIGYELVNDLESVIKETATFLIKRNIKSYKVEVRRIEKIGDLTSSSLKKKLALLLDVSLKNHKIFGLLNNYEQQLLFYFWKDKVWLLTAEFLAIGGLPVDHSKRGLVLLSGGIDSPVAASLILKKGFAVDFVCFTSFPSTPKELEHKVQSLARKITLNNSLTVAKLFFIDINVIQQEIAHLSKPKYRTIILRRIFVKLALKLALIHGHDFLVTGDALGQVASQTVEGLKVVDQVLSDEMIIFRPLLTFDKAEIIKLAIFFGTYELSIIDCCDTCSNFSPTHPIIFPRIKDIAELETEISENLDVLLQFVFEKKLWEVKV